MQRVVARTVVIAGGLMLAACSPSRHTTSRVSPNRSSTTASTASTSSTKSPRTAREAVREAWPVGRSTVWVWTSSEGYIGREHVLTSSDGGRSWRDVTPAGLAHLTARRQIDSLFVLNGEHAFLTVKGLPGSGPQSLLGTADGGGHWTKVSASLPSCHIDFVSPARGWCVDDRATMGQDPVRIWRTTDGGGSWQAVNLHHTLPVGYDKNIGFSTANLGWVVTNSAGGNPPIYRSLDAGSRWTQSTVKPAAGNPGYGSGFTGLPVASAGHVAVAFDQGRPLQTLIYRSSNNGASWRWVRPPGPTRRWHVEIRTPRSWILIHATTLLRTDNAGRTWTRTTMNRPLDPETDAYYWNAPGIEFPTHTIGWVAQYDPTGLWRTTTAGRTWNPVTIPRT